MKPGGKKVTGKALKPSSRPKKLDWHREPDDMENTFVRESTFIVNSALFLPLIILVGLLNSNKVCPPPNFLLNPKNLKLHSCNYSMMRNVTETNALYPYNETTPTFIAFNSSSPNETTTNEISAPQFYLFNTLVFGAVIPLGLTSIMMAKSGEWIPTLQNLAIITKLQRKKRKFVTVDVLKSVVVVVCMAFFAMYMLPIGLSVSNISDHCQITPIICIVSFFLLLLLTVSLLGLDIWEIKNIFKAKTYTRGSTFVATDEKKLKLLKKLKKYLKVRSILSFAISIFSMAMLSVTSVQSIGVIKRESCSENPSPIMIYLIVSTSIVMITSMLLFLRYIKEQRNYVC